MKCHACQAHNRDIVKYCEDCGTQIAVACSRCGFSVPMGKKFCGQCGHKLSDTAIIKADDGMGQGTQGPDIDFNRPDSYTPKFMAEKILTTRSSIEGERKLVTVFFCDVTGFTSLSEQLDPETVHEIMDGCFKILMEEIHTYEGTINQFTGDGVMALFGAPIAHEDHAQRACHASLAIQAALKEYGQKVDEAYGTNFKMRIGLNSGPVVVGAIGDDLRMDYTAVGDTTNLAARMESMADPEGILISASTHRQVSRYFETQSLGPVNVKGKKEPQQVYKLLGSTGIESRLDASRSRGLVKYIGREEELIDLTKAYDKAASGQGCLVGVVGEPGIGKSRFVFEMQRQTNDDCKFMETRCLQYSSSIPFRPVLNLVKGYFNIGGDETKANLDSKLTEGLGKDLAVHLPAFRQFLSLPPNDAAWESQDPKEKRMGIFEALRNFFLALAKDNALVIAVDDLQWLDKTSEEFLDYFIDWIGNSKILLILLFRQEYSHSWGGKSFYKQIGLPPLTNSQSLQFIESILNDGEVSKDVSDLIISRTSGNPLFMEELTISLLENQILLKQDGQYRLGETTLLDQVPDTIQGIITARMDRLNENVKSTMQVASVIGRKFAARLVHALTDPDQDARQYLIKLQNLEFIHEKQVLPELEYVFKNPITQEVAYNSLLLNRRRQIHSNCARAILEMYPDQKEAYYEIIAFHFSKSDNYDEAATYLKLSGDKAIQNNSAWEALAFYKKALATVEHLPTNEKTDEQMNQRKLELLHALITPTILLDFPKGSLGLLEQGAETAKALDDCKSTIRFHSNMGFYHSVHGHPEEGIKFSGKAFAQATAIKDLEAMAQAAPDLIMAHMARGRYKEALDITSSMIPAIQEANRQTDTFGGPAMVYFTFYTIQGYTRACLGDFSNGLADCHKGLEAAETQGNLFTLNLCRFYSGLTYILKGDWETAHTLIDQCVKEIEKVDFLLIEALSRGSLGLIHAFRDDPATGQDFVEQGLAILQENGLEWNLTAFLQNIGICKFMAKDFENALAFMEQALETTETIDDPPGKATALIWGGRTNGRLADHPNAENMIREGIDLMNQLGAKPGAALGQFFLGELLADVGRTDEAAEQLKNVQNQFKSLEMTYWSDQARSLQGI